MYKHDGRHIVRRGTDEEARYRLSAFRAGWTDALNSRIYTEQTLTVVKWKNLGWRFGRTLGMVAPAVQETIFEILADLQIATLLADEKLLEEGAMFETTSTADHQTVDDCASSYAEHQALEQRIIASKPYMTFAEQATVLKTIYAGVTFEQLPLEVQHIIQSAEQRANQPKLDSANHQE